MPRKKLNKPASETNDSHNKQIQGIELPVHWNVPDEIPTLHVTNFVVQYIPNEFILSFFEIRPPILVDFNDAQNFIAKKPTIEAQCLARLAVTPERMEEFIKILQQNLANNPPKYQKDESTSESAVE